MPVDMEVDEGVAVLTLNRPEKHNSIDRPMRAELKRAWERLATDRDIRVAVITGAGTRAFCTGSDLTATPKPDHAFAADLFGGNGSDHLLAGLDEAGIPLIAAVNGYAIGGGMEIALACDIRLASGNASFGLSEVRVGSIPGAGGTQRLPRAVGQSLAMQMLLTGDRIGADHALRAGLVSEVLPGKELLPRALAIATRIAANAPLSVRAIKQLVHRGLDAPLEVAMRLEHAAFGLIRETDDRAEGRAAFTEGRPARFTGR
ncbi:enoyl-CoA hydratase/isomerase family protein [Actinophytocola oryzae]|uniref:enoyl-CoA hydratase n=1 Tax=Actinophytocola oryzae TaxID=502181 RepID=A0A4R7W4U5_9PSEU|nr:enoyl-CoA hydratase/isomerase family protein [Actinophytocola oryzae]TDV57743.1 E-phenylitaconyl-CoA hydratase [Actinophytocola oryzae]